MNNNDFNILCAEYLGYDYYGWNSPLHRMSEYKKGYWGLKEAKIHSLKLFHTYLLRPLRFHDDWNWLMRVKNKIIQEGIVFKITSSQKHSHGFLLNVEKTVDDVNINEFELTKNLIIKFLQYKNANN